MQISAKQLRKLVRETVEEMVPTGEEITPPGVGSREEAGERLEEIHAGIADLLEEAMRLTAKWAEPRDAAAARGNWYGHMKMSLGRGHGYPSRGTTLEDTAEALLYGPGGSPAYRESQRVPGGEALRRAMGWEDEP